MKTIYLKGVTKYSGHFARKSTKLSSIHAARDEAKKLIVCLEETNNKGVTK
jgi:hypothetical protein